MKLVFGKKHLLMELVQFIKSSLEIIYYLIFKIDFQYFNFLFN